MPQIKIRMSAPRNLTFHIPKAPELPRFVSLDDGLDLLRFRGRRQPNAAQRALVKDFGHTVTFGLHVVGGGGSSC